MPDSYKCKNVILRPERYFNGSQYVYGGTDWLHFEGDPETVLRDGSDDTYVEWNGAFELSEAEFHFDGFNPFDYQAIAVRTRHVDMPSGHRRNQVYVEGTGLWDVNDNGFRIVADDFYYSVPTATYWYTESWTGTTELNNGPRTISEDVGLMWWKHPAHLLNPAFDTGNDLHLVCNFTAQWQHRIFEVELLCYRLGEIDHGLPIMDLDDTSKEATIYASFGLFASGNLLVDQKGRLLTPISTGNTNHDNAPRVTWESGQTSWSTYDAPMYITTPRNDGIAAVARLPEEGNYDVTADLGNYSVLPNRPYGTHMLVYPDMEDPEAAWDFASEGLRFLQFTRNGYLLREDWIPRNGLTYRASATGGNAYREKYPMIPFSGGFYNNRFTCIVAEDGNSWYEHQTIESHGGPVLRIDFSSRSIERLDVPHTMATRWGLVVDDNWPYSPDRPTIKSVCVDHRDGSLWLLYAADQTSISGEERPEFLFSANGWKITTPYNPHPAQRQYYTATAPTQQPTSHYGLVILKTLSGVTVGSPLPPGVSNGTPSIQYAGSSLTFNLSPPNAMTQAENANINAGYAIINSTGYEDYTGTVLAVFTATADPKKDTGMWIMHTDPNGAFVSRSGFYYGQEGYTEDYCSGITMDDEGFLLVSGSCWDTILPEYEGIFRIPSTAIGTQEFLNLEPFEFFNAPERYRSGQGTGVQIPVPINNPNLKGLFNDRQARFSEGH